MKIIITESQIRTVLLEINAIDKLDSIEMPPQAKIIAQIIGTPDEDDETNDTGDVDNTPKTRKTYRKRSFNHPLGNSRKFKVSSNFNSSRGNRKHNAVDIAAPTGTPVYAPTSGIVVYAGDIRKRCGGFVKIHHGDYKTKYCHLSKWVVNRGQKVKAGQIIGYVGGGPKDLHKGVSTGSHLHYEILTKSGRHVNPEQSQFGFA